MHASNLTNLCRLIVILSILSGCGIDAMHAQSQLCCLVTVRPQGVQNPGILIGPGTPATAYNASEAFQIYGCGCTSSTLVWVQSPGQIAWGSWCGGGSCQPQSNSEATVCPGQFGATTSTPNSWSVSILPRIVFTAPDTCEVDANGIACNQNYTAVGSCISQAASTNVYPAQSCYSSSIKLSNRSTVLAALNSEADSPYEASAISTAQRYRCSITGEKMSRASVSKLATKWKCSQDASDVASIQSGGFRRVVHRERSITE
jgi:hypothetical protein